MFLLGKHLAESRCSSALPAWLDSLQSSMLAAACSHGIQAVCLLHTPSLTHMLSVADVCVTRLMQATAGCTACELMLVSSGTPAVYVELQCMWNCSV